MYQETNDESRTQKFKQVFSEYIDKELDCDEYFKDCEEKYRAIKRSILISDSTSSSSPLASDVEEDVRKIRNLMNN